MKKIFLFFFLFVSFFAAAQKKNTTLFKLYAEAGINNAHYKTPASINNTGNIQGIHSGLNIDYSLKNNFSIQSGIFIDGKGGKQSYSVMSVWGTYENATVKIYYLQIPVSLIKRFILKKSSNIFFGLGSYISTGLFGENNYFGYSWGVVGGYYTGSANVKFGKSDIGYSSQIYSIQKQIDIGYLATIGFEKFFFSFPLLSQFFALVCSLLALKAGCQLAYKHAVSMENHRD